MVNKHSVPIFDKPMIYYPLTTLILAGIKDIVVVSTSLGVEAFQLLLGGGERLGISIQYKIQDEPLGIADAITKALSCFDQNDSLLVILGDNIFYGTGLGRHISEVIDNEYCSIWTQEVSNPEDFGIVTLDSNNIPISIVEKPEYSDSKLAITGLYFFPRNLIDKIKDIKPSKRGEFEVTDILSAYLDDQKLKVISLERGIYWVDAGTVENLSDASLFVKMVQSRQGKLIGSPEEASYRTGNITADQLNMNIESMPKSDYKSQLEKQFKKSANDG